MDMIDTRLARGRPGPRVVTDVSAAIEQSLAGLLHRRPSMTSRGFLYSVESTLMRCATVLILDFLAGAVDLEPPRSRSPQCANQFQILTYLLSPVWHGNTGPS